MELHICLHMFYAISDIYRSGRFIGLVILPLFSNHNSDDFLILHKCGAYNPSALAFVRIVLGT